MPGSAIPSAQRMQDSINARMGIVQAPEQRIVSGEGYDTGAQRSIAERIAKARIAGASDEQIVSILSETNPRVKQAHDAGGTPEQIFRVLTETHTGQPYIDANRTRGNQAEIDRGARARDYRAQEADGPQRGWLGQRGEDFVAPGRAAAALADEGAAQATMPGVGNQLVGPMKEIGGALGVLATPVTGALNLINAPAGRAMERRGLPGAVVEAPLNAAEMLIPGSQAARLAGALRSGAPAAKTATAASDLAKLLAKNAPDVETMRTAAASQRAAGAEPSFIDVAGSQGKRLARALGVKNDAAGEVLERGARNTAGATKPQAISAAMGLTPQRQTADQLAEALTKARDAQASTAYKGPYETPVPATPESAEALRSETGQTAIALAMRAARDMPEFGPQVAGELQGVLSAVQADGEIPSVSARALDIVRRQLRNMADGFGANPETRMQAAGARNRMSQLDKALEGVEGLKAARADYARSTGAIDVLAGENFRDPFSTDPRDYADWLGGLTDEARAANQNRIKQDLIDALAGRRQSALGQMDDIATNLFAKANLPAALGASGNQYRDLVEALLAQRRNATEIAPSTGSKTAVVGADLGNLQDAASGMKAVGSLGRGDVLGAGMESARLWAKRFGVSDDLALQTVTAAVDRTGLDALLDDIERARGPGVKDVFLREVLPQIAAGALEQAPKAIRAGAAANEALQSQ